MVTIKKTITINQVLYKLIKDHNEKNASSVSGVIGLALKKFFKKNDEKK